MYHLSKPIQRLINDVLEKGMLIKDGQTVDEANLDLLPVDDSYFRETILLNSSDLYYKSLCNWLRIAYTLFPEERKTKNIILSWANNYVNREFTKGGGEKDMVKKENGRADLKERNAKIVADAKAGKTIVDIAKAYGLSYVRVWNLVKDIVKKVPKTTTKVAPKAKKSVVKPEPVATPEIPDTDVKA